MMKLKLCGFIISAFLTACSSNNKTLQEQNIAAIQNSTIRDMQTNLKAEQQIHEFVLPQGIEINLSTLKLFEGDTKVRDNINRFLEDHTIEALNFTNINEGEQTQFYSLQDVVKANLEEYKNYVEIEGDGWVDLWTISQIYSLGFQNEKLLIVEFQNDYNWGIVKPIKPEKKTLCFDTQTGNFIKNENLFIDKSKSLAIIKEALVEAMLAIKNNPIQIQNSLSQINFPQYLMIQEDNIHCIYSAADDLPEEFGTIYVDIPLPVIADEIKYL